MNESLIGIFLLFLVTSQCLAVEEKHTYMAVGDGFQITYEDVDKFKKFCEENNFFTSEEEYKRALVQITLFAKEAVALNLHKVFEGTVGDNIAAVWEMQNLYVNWLGDNYHVSDMVIESYYWAFSDKTADNFLPPLDDELKKIIRGRVIKAKKKVLAEEAYSNLKKKYNVHFCKEGDAGGGCEKI